MILGLNKMATLERYIKQDGNTPIYAAPETVKCRVEHVRAVTMTGLMEGRISHTKLFLKPVHDVPELSQVTIDGHKYLVGQTAPKDGFTYNHLELMLV